MRAKTTARQGAIQMTFEAAARSAKKRTFQHRSKPHPFVALRTLSFENDPGECARKQPRHRLLATRQRRSAVFEIMRAAFEVAPYRFNDRVAFTVIRQLHEGQLSATDLQG